MVQKFSRKNRQYRAIRDKIFYGLFVFCTLIGVLCLAILLIDVFLDGYRWVIIDFITNYASRFPEQSGILSPLMGTLWVVGLTALMVIPIGLGTAIYLEEFAEDNFITRMINLNISNLAGVPSELKNGGSTVNALAAVSKFWTMPREPRAAPLVIMTENPS